MDRKKKKAAANKSKLVQAKQRKDMHNRFIERIREMTKLIAGKEMLDQIPPDFFEHIYQYRYNSLKPITAAGSGVPKSKVVQFHKLMLELLEGVEIDIPNGNKIPFIWYLSEAQSLVDRIACVEPEDPAIMVELKKRFAPFLNDGEIYVKVQNLLADLVTRISVFLSDYNNHIYRADLAMTPYFETYDAGNFIHLHAFKPVIENVMTKEGPRNAVRLGWVDIDLKWQYFKVKPSTLGFRTPGLDIPLDLYISKHALQRLNERINLSPGIMHELLFYIFLEDKIPHTRKGNDCLVDYPILDQKAGYFWVRMFENKLMIHTFLFLTNNQTPEGEKLNRLLDLAVEDKKYLEIDSLPDFNAYHIDQNEKVSKMFKDAGCGSLLKLGHLKPFFTNEVADKDPESIVRYLESARYFQDQLLIPLL